ncbi:MAG: cache domain-containing sensor histidine kinase [Cellulosilyticaceae bacterium]
MNKKSKNQSLQQQIITSFLILVIGITIIASSFHAYQLHKSIEKDTHIYSYEIVKQLGRTLDGYIQHMKELLWIVTNQEEDLIEKLREPLTQPTAKKSVFLEELRKRDGKATDIVSIHIFGENGLVLTDGIPNQVKDYIDVRELAWYKEAVEADGATVVSSSHTQNYLKNDTRWVFSVSAAIKDGEDILGVALIDMSYKTVMDMCNEIRLGEQGYIYIVNQKGDMIYHPKQQLIYSGILKEDVERITELEEGSFTERVGARRLATVHTIEEAGWHIVGVSYIGELLVSMKEMIIPGLCVTLLCIVVSWVIARRMARRISEPVRQLQDKMRQVEEGKLDDGIEVACTTLEIESLTYSFKKMISRIQELIEEAKDQQRRLRKSELSILQAQINPHFLYNTLDTIIWLGEKEEHEKVVHMTAALARYFRLSLSKGKEIITIYEEIQHIKHYLEIQKIRYADKLSYEIDIQPEVFDYMTVKITLQPLVENALYHGIRDVDGGGCIRVSAWKEEERIVFEVYDNGKGMTSEQLETIFTRPLPKSITKGGVAIKNVQQRIKIYFGNDYGLTYSSQEGCYTSVKVTIPLLEAGEVYE